ncbi:hypothetical protein [Butyrivibrio sp.]|uniref:hypothetical protein n=1 Tax=Butyrivibrio sp. TaxID=28121 RepID=UPI0025BED172|nr:hypothetical protein [Butyrivibrio sp.]MBQ7428339.1 hypothetical protein [Butyrivibrio sp.]MBQ9303642.1 hypothetical protein [Butyrivibrio sp.]
MNNRRYQAIIQRCDAEGKILHKASIEDIKDNIQLSDGKLSNKLQPYIFKDEQKSQTLVGGVHSQNTKIIYQPYPFDAFLADVEDVMADNDYITAIDSVMKSKNIILVKQE